MELAGIQNSLIPEQAANPVPQGVDPKLVEATRQFEALFLRQFLGNALKPVLHETPESKGPGSGIYQFMMTDVIAQSLTQQEHFGISSLLQMQLAGSPVPDAPAGGKAEPASNKE